MDIRKRSILKKIIRKEDGVSPLSTTRKNIITFVLLISALFTLLGTGKDFLEALGRDK